MKIGHNTGDGTVYCDLCGWSRKCDNIEKIEHFLQRHLWEVHGVELQYRREMENGEEVGEPKRIPQ